MATKKRAINFSVVGIRGRGKAHYNSFAKLPNVKVATLCDIDESLFPTGVADVEKIAGYRPTTEVDYRKVLEDKTIDAVSLATPEHWHALQIIWACQAGKDVFVEKPVSHNIWEGRKAVQAARKYNRVVQSGTQHRSNPGFQEAVKFIQDGKLGDIYMAKATAYKYRESIGNTKDSPIPKGVHWDLFLGPAPYRPFNKNRFHYNWHWFWDTGTTELGGQGVHQLDVIRWALNKRVHPVKIHAAGNCFVYEDSDWEVPNIQHSIYEYEDGLLVQMEVRNLFTNQEAGQNVCNLFYGSEGWMVISGGGDFETYFGRKNEPGPSLKLQEAFDHQNRMGSYGGGHFSNFIDCVRTGKWQELNADILEGHMSSAICHLANISNRTGRKLTFNPHSERFVNDDDANAYLKREYRYPYIIPDEV